MTCHSNFSPATYRKGIYFTIHGSCAYVSGPRAKTGYDLDTRNRIPMCEVTRQFIREAEIGDTPPRGGEGAWG